MGKRVDAVLVLADLIVIVEYKIGAKAYKRNDLDQVLDYALDLANFHEGSHGRLLAPVLVATEAPPTTEPFIQYADKIYKPIRANGDTLLSLLQRLANHDVSEWIDPVAWAQSSYKPTPTIVEAAHALYHGHDVREISRSEAGAENLSRTTDYVGRLIERAKSSKKKIVCFLTGIPGSGKTLAGLNLATHRQRKHEDEHAAFLSGNGPLVSVLRRGARTRGERAKADQ